MGKWRKRQPARRPRRPPYPFDTGPVDVSPEVYDLGVTPDQIRRVIELHRTGAAWRLPRGVSLPIGGLPGVRVPREAETVLIYRHALADRVVRQYEAEIRSLGVVGSWFSMFPASFHPVPWTGFLILRVVTDLRRPRTRVSAPLQPDFRAQLLAARKKNPARRPAKDRWAGRRRHYPAKDRWEPEDFLSMTFKERIGPLEQYPRFVRDKATGEIVLIRGQFPPKAKRQRRQKGSKMVRRKKNPRRFGAARFGIAGVTVTMGVMREIQGEPIGRKRIRGLGYVQGPTILLTLLDRHTRGDWGSGVEGDDRKLNDREMRRGFGRMLSQFDLRSGAGELRVWVISEGREGPVPQWHTTVLLPDEY